MRKKDNVRKLTKTGRGRSYCVVLPREAVSAFGWQDRQKLVVEADYSKKQFVIKDWRVK